MGKEEKVVLDAIEIFAISRMAEILNPSERWNEDGWNIISRWSHFDRYNPRYLNGIIYRIVGKVFTEEFAFGCCQLGLSPSYSIHHEVWWIEFRGRKAQSRSIERLWIKVNHVKREFTINPNPRGGAWERGKFNFTRILVEKSFVPIEDFVRPGKSIFFYFLFFSKFISNLFNSPRR